jgi:photoactive yellow protein
MIYDPRSMTFTFDGADLIDLLESSPLEAFDAVEFGLIVMNRSGDVVWYNEFESKRAGISRDRVVGGNFFDSMGLCMNNYLVAQRYLDEPDLDDVIEFVLTLRMSPTPVHLRMLARAGSERQYLAIRNR